METVVTSVRLVCSSARVQHEGDICEKTQLSNTSSWWRWAILKLWTHANTEASAKLPLGKGGQGQASLSPRGRQGQASLSLLLKEPSVLGASAGFTLFAFVTDCGSFAAQLIRWNHWFYSILSTMVLKWFRLGVSRTVRA